MRKIAILVLAAICLFVIDASAQNNGEKSYVSEEQEKSKSKKSATPRKGDVLIRGSLLPSSLSNVNSQSLMSAYRLGVEVIVADNVLGLGSLGLGVNGHYARDRYIISDGMGNFNTAGYNRTTIAPRVVLHLETGVKNLDLYTGLELRILMMSADHPANPSSRNYLDYSVRSFIGANYYISKRIALFGELGFDGFRTGINFRL